MKKICILLLVIIFIVTVFPVYAEEGLYNNFYEINLNIGKKVVKKKIVIKDNELYMWARDFSDFTMFSYDTQNKIFLIKNQELKKAYKYLIVDDKKKQVNISSYYTVDLVDCLNIDGKIYLPFSQMLPMLNADIYKVENNTVFISKNEISLAEILYDFNITDYCFDLSHEVANENKLGLGLILPSYILDTILNYRFDRLSPTIANIPAEESTYKDYEAVFLDLLMDDELYNQATKGENDPVEDFAEDYDQTVQNLDDSFTVMKWLESAGASSLSSKAGGKLFEILKDTFKSVGYKESKIKKLYDVWDNSSTTISEIGDAVNYIVTRIYHIQDNREMLNAVYDVHSKKQSPYEFLMRVKKRAASHIYDLYGEEFLLPYSKEIFDKCIKEGMNVLITKFNPYFILLDLADFVLDKVMPVNYNEMSNLHLYADVAMDATEVFQEMRFHSITDQEVEKLRLSLLLSLKSSEKCYTIMKEASKSWGYDTSKYENKIHKIQEVIKKVYLTKRNVEFDSFQHIEEYHKKNNEKLQEIIDNPLQYNLDENTAYEIATELIAAYETYQNIYVCCDLDYENYLSNKETDNIREMLTEEQKVFLMTPYKCLCCKNYEQALEHAKRRMDESLLKDFTDNYVIYENNLYFFMGAKGGITYENVRLSEYSNDQIIAYADFKGSASPEFYDEEYRFVMNCKSGNYKLISVEEVQVKEDYSLQNENDEKEYIDFIRKILRKNGKLNDQQVLQLEENTDAYINVVVGTDTPEKFTAEGYYTLEKSSKILKDVMTNEILE